MCGTRVHARVYMCVWGGGGPLRLQEGQQHKPQWHGVEWKGVQRAAPRGEQEASMSV